jgi:hypothetical protein
VARTWGARTAAAAGTAPPAAAAARSAASHQLPPTTPTLEGTHGSHVARRVHARVVRLRRGGRPAREVLAPRAPRGRVHGDARGGEALLCLERLLNAAAAAHGERGEEREEHDDCIYACVSRRTEEGGRGAQMTKPMPARVA